MLYGKVVSFRTRVVTAFAGIVFFVLAGFASSDSQANCSRTCIAENCDLLAIRYGKYCGKGYGGCAGEQPCDDVDACCMVHDECVTLKGMAYVKCHRQFKHCINGVQNSGKVGFSRECPYGTAIPTMRQGIDLGIFLLEKTCGILSTICNVTIPLLNL